MAWMKELIEQDICIECNITSHKPNEAPQNARSPPMVSHPLNHVLAVCS